MALTHTPHINGKNRILRRSDVVTETGLSSSTIRRLELAGKFPPRLKLSAQAVGWREAEVREWIANRQQVANGAE
jgi:prophage regulatory protein